MRNDSIFPFIFFHIFISIPKVNWFLGQFTTLFINVKAPNNDLSMDELNVIYRAQKL